METLKVGMRDVLKPGSKTVCGDELILGQKSMEIR